MTNPAIIIHGGAGPWEKDNHDIVLTGMRGAVTKGWEVLRNGGTALDAVEASTVILEDHPLFDAGVGSFLNDQGEVELDALITDGSQIKFGAIAGVMHIKNPITLARVILSDAKHCFYVAEGAELLGFQLGMEYTSNLSFVTTEEFSAYQRRLEEGKQPEDQGHGTVGAVALDANGNIASATSTGGSPHKRKGRVGDVPVFGAGGYSDNAYGGASATGIGENIMRYFLSKQVIDNIAQGKDANTSAIEGVNLIADKIPNPEVGVIVVDAQGNVGASHTTAHMPIAWIDTEGNIHAEMTNPYSF